MNGMLYKASPYQKNIIYMTERYAGTPIGNIGGLDCYKRRIPYEMAADILKKMVLMHPAIRLRLRSDGMLYLPPYEEPEILYYDFRDHTEKEIIALANEWLREEIPMYEHNLFELKYIDGPEYSYAFFKFHHLISDGVTFVLMLQEQEQMQNILLSGEALKCKEDTAYIRLLENGEYGSSRLKERAVNWYRNQYTGKNASWKLKETAQSPKAERIAYTVDTKLMHKITDYIKANGIFCETLIYGAVFSYIFAQKKENTAAIGRVLANRTKHTMQSYGLYANTLPLFFEKKPKETTLQYLKRMQCELFEQQKYAAYGYEELAETLGFSESMYDISISYRPKRLFPVDEISVGMELFNGCSEIPLRIFVEELDGQLFITMQYQCECYRKEEIDAIYRRICYLMEQMIAEISPEELSIVTPEDEAIIRQFEQVLALSYEKTVLEEIEGQMMRHPKHPAVLTGKVQITYKELEKRMYQTAFYLKEREICRGDIVSVCLERSTWLTAVLLGIWKAGAAFLTINTVESDDRKATLGEVSRYCITERDIAKIADIDAKKAAESLQACKEEPLRDEAAYLMYTSGTTGTPKAAVISHKSLKLRLQWMLETYGCEEMVLQKTTYTFDVSIWELFLPLMAGMTSYMLKPGAEKFPDQIGDTIEAGAISMLHFVPTMLQAFLREAKSKNKVYPQVKTIICSGEALPAAAVKAAYEIFPDSKIANFYGPTECTIDVLHYPCEKTDIRIPIGKPVANTGAYIVNAKHRLLPPGIEGEICITGDLVGQGYYQMESEAFGSFCDSPAYFTGDYGILDFDGNIYYCGRKDRQYKVRGMRIDLSALEDVLHTHPKVQRAVSTVRNERIEVCCLSDGEIPDLKQWLAKKLPPHQIPAQIYFFSSFPCNKNGKLDEKALWEQARENSRKADRSDTCPINEKEAFLQDVIGKALGIEQMLVTQSFLEAGLDSFSAFGIVTELREHGFTVSYEDFYRYTNIRELAAGGRQQEELLCCLKEKNPDTRKLFLGIPYAGGTPWLYYPLSKHKEFQEYAFYAVSFRGFQRKRVEWIAKETVRRLLETGEYEEYVIFGYCVGSTTAVAIAGELEKRKKKVRLCIAASQPTKGITVGKRVYSCWDFCSKDILRKILERMHGMPGIISEEMTEQFRIDVRRFLDYFNRHKQIPIQGACSLILAEKDVFTPGEQKSLFKWAAFLDKAPADIRVYKIGQGGHFFLQKCKEQAALVIKQAIKTESK